MRMRDSSRVTVRRRNSKADSIGPDHSWLHFAYKWTDIRESRNSPDLRSFTKYVWGGKNKTRKGIT